MQSGANPEPPQLLAPTIDCNKTNVVGISIFTKSLVQVTFIYLWKKLIGWQVMYGIQGPGGALTYPLHILYPVAFAALLPVVQSLGGSVNLAH